MSVEVVVPEDYMGDVIGDLNSRRGRILGMTQRGNAQVIDAEVPLATMFGYVDRPAQQDAGPRDLHDAVLALRSRSPTTSRKRSSRRSRAAESLTTRRRDLLLEIHRRERHGQGEIRHEPSRT